MKVTFLDLQKINANIEAELVAACQKVISLVIILAAKR